MRAACLLTRLGAYRVMGSREVDGIEIVTYDPRWSNLFDQEAKWLRAILDPSLIVGLEHFGSTAIPALPAKPIMNGSRDALPPNIRMIARLIPTPNPTMSKR